jgi:hypothetical protein
MIGQWAFRPVRPDHGGPGCSVAVFERPAAVLGKTAHRRRRPALLSHLTVFSNSPCLGARAGLMLVRRMFWASRVRRPLRQCETMNLAGDPDRCL